MDSRSHASKIKSLGLSGKSATSHFVHQRITALLLIPCCIWFVISVICLSSSIERELLPFLISPVNLVFVLFFLVCGVYHGFLGMQVVIEDYVHCKHMKRLVIFLLFVLSLVSVLIAVISALSLHLKFSMLIP